MKRLREFGHDTLGLARQAEVPEDATLDLFDETTAALVVAGKRAEVLVHLAWSVRAPDFRDSPDNARWLDASIALARNFVSSGGTSIVLAGTCSEYGNGSAQPLRELDHAAPSDAYGRSKHALYEYLAREFGDRARISSARIFYPYGPGEAHRKLVSALIEEISAGRLPPLREPDRLIDYIFVDDVAEALVRMAERATLDTVADISGVINVGTGVGVSAREIAAHVARRIRPAMLDAVNDMPHASTPSLPIIADVTRMHALLGEWKMTTLENGLDKML